MRSKQVTVVKLSDEDIHRAFEQYVKIKNPNMEETTLTQIEIYADGRHHYIGDMYFEPK